VSLPYLDDSDAFAEGAPLWILASLEQSLWTRKLDWYLNLQLLRAEPHRPQHLSDFLKQLLAQQELAPLLSSVSAQSPLMIAAQAFVPTDQIVILFETETKPWVQSAHHIWNKLGKPATRLFLPDFVSAANLNNVWPKDAPITLIKPKHI
jgi:hypothetical protein